MNKLIAQVSDPKIRSRLRQARRVNESGKRLAAAKLYREIIAESPEIEAAWVGLAETSINLDEKKDAYDKILTFAPESQAAQAGLAELESGSLPGIGPSSNPDKTDSSKTDDPFNQSRAGLAEATTQQREKPLVPSRIKAGTAEPAIEPLLDHQDHSVTDVQTSEEYDLVCYRHPNRETSLRCYTCNKPICVSCAVKTPVGYRCPDCVRETEDVFFTAATLDYVIAFLVSFPLSLIAGTLALRLGGGFLFIFITVIAAGGIGSLIGRITFRTIGRRRGRYIPHLVAANVILGVLIPAGLGFLLLGALPALLIPGIYLFVATSAAFYQMK